MTRLIPLAILFAPAVAFISPARAGDSVSLLLTNPQGTQFEVPGLTRRDCEAVVKLIEPSAASSGLILFSIDSAGNATTPPAQSSLNPRCVQQISKH